MSLVGNHVQASVKVNLGYGKGNPHWSLPNTKKDTIYFELY